MNEVLAALIFFLPAGVSNMTPVLANKVPILNQWHTPVDFGKSLDGIRIFGDHKTWRGIVTGTVLGTLVGAVIIQLGEAPTVHYSYALVFAMSLGALVGDAVKSFFKRRIGVASGKSWFPFDQLDYIIGGLLASAPFGVLSPQLVLYVFMLYFVLHLIVTYGGYRLHLKKDPI